MRVLVTGATGFLGSRVVHRSVEAGHDVVALVRPTSSFARLDMLRDRITLATITPEESDLSDVLRRAGPFDAVIHAAATYGKGERMSSIVATNVVFGLALLEACGPRVGAFVNVGTALPSTVSDYAATKRRFSAWGMHEADREGWPFANLAVELMYGPGDPVNRLVPTLITACLSHALRVALTEGRQVRDFVYVDDVASAALAACQVSLSDQTRRRFSVSVGTGVGTTVREVAEWIRRDTGARTELAFGEIPYRQHEVMRSVADSSARELIGWNPTVALPDGLHRTIESYRSAMAAESSR